MTKFFLIVIAVLAFIAFLFLCLFLMYKNKADENKELYEECRKNNIAMAQTIGKLQAAEIIKQEERENADEKINKAYNGTASERFNAITNGLRNNNNANNN